MVAKVKNHKAGFVTSDSNIRPDQTIAEAIALKENASELRDFNKLEISFDIYQEGFNALVRMR